VAWDIPENPTLGKDYTRLVLLRAGIEFKTAWLAQRFFAAQALFTWYKCALLHNSTLLLVYFILKQIDLLGMPLNVPVVYIDYKVIYRIALSVPRQSAGFGK